MNRIEKVILSFIIAFCTPWVIAMILYPFINFFALVLGLGLCVWTMWKGKYTNKVLENSIGTFIGGRVGYVLPEGTSWWLPPPIGGTTNATPVGTRVLDKTRTSGKQLIKAETSDGIQHEASYRVAYRIIDLFRWITYEGDTESSLGNTLDERMRKIIAGHTATGNTAISARSSIFHDFFVKKASITLPDGNVMDGAEFAKRLMDLFGVELEDVPVDDVNPPTEISEAQALDAMTQLLTNKGIPEAEARQQAMALAGYTDVVRVEGDVGDFTTGAAVGNSPNRGGRGGRRNRRDR